MQMTRTEIEFVKILKLKKKKVGEYHGLYVYSDTLLLADVFGNFKNMCLKIDKLDPARFLTAPTLQ